MSRALRHAIYSRPITVRPIPNWLGIVNLHDGHDAQHLTAYWPALSSTVYLYVTSLCCIEMAIWIELTCGTEAVLHISYTVL